MIKRQAWSEFKKSGLLWWINRTLHLFGWAIVFVVEDSGEISDVYPARVGFRGFPESSEDEGFQTLTSYLNDNAAELKREIQDPPV